MKKRAHWLLAQGSFAISNTKKGFTGTVVSLLAMLFLLSSTVPAQTPTPASTVSSPPPSTTLGTINPPTGGSYKNFGPVTINLANLDIHLSVPIYSKPGRGVPFSYSLQYDSQIWSSGTSSSGFTASPALDAGWHRGGPFGWVYYLADHEVDCAAGGTYSQDDWSDYTDAEGNMHSFTVAEDLNQTGNATECSANLQPGANAFNDGSGLSYVQATSGAFAGILTNAGAVIQPFQITLSGALPNFSMTAATGASITDSNGNVLSASLSPPEIVDTIGVVYPIGGSFWQPTSLGYTDSSGTSRSVLIQWGTYNVEPNFCSNAGKVQLASEALPQSVTYADGSVESFTYEMIGGSSTNTTGRIASVTLRTGGTISFAYSGGSNGLNCIDGSTAGFTLTTSDGVWSFAHPNPTTTSSSTTVTDAKGNQTVINFMKGYETQRQVYQGSSTGTPLVTFATCYNGNKSNCATTAISAVPITELSQITTLPNGDAKETDTLFNNPSATVAQVNESLWGVGGVGGPGRETVIQYASLSNGILNHPSSVTVFDATTSTPTQMSQTTYGYDESAVTTITEPQLLSVSGSRGNRTSIHRWLNTTGGFLTTAMTYLSGGEVYKVTDPMLNVTTYGYGQNGSAVSEVTNSVYSTSTTNNGIAGVMSTSTDANGQVTKYAYDLMNRLTTINYPDGGETTVTFFGPLSTSTQQTMNSSQSNIFNELIDGYGRKSRTARSNGEGGWDQHDFSYDADGLPSFTAYPYQGTGWATPQVTSGAGDSVTYDAMGRITKLTHSDGTAVTYTQEGRNVQITDESGNSHILNIDALGRLINVCEISSATLVGVGGTPVNCGLDLPGTGFLTTYGYDILGNLTSVVQSGLNPRKYTYDSLSRILSATDPESGTTCYGTYSGSTCQANGYDADGDLLYRTDARGIVTSYTYGSLNRLTQINYSDGVTPQVNFWYDSGPDWSGPFTNMIGRLGEMWTGTSIQTASVFSYDPMGRIIMNNQPTPGAPAGGYPMSYTYDLAGDLLTSTISPGATVTYGYNLAKRVTSVTSSFTGTNFPATLFSNAHYNAFGERVSASYGTVGSTSGISEIRSYDTRGRATGAFTQLNGGAGLEAFGGITYYPNGNMETVSDAINYGGTWTYSYDAFNRLSSASDLNDNGTTSTYNYSYDVYGNRWSETGGFNQAFNANNQIVGFSYDANGNLLSDGNHKYTYDAQNRLSTVDGGSANGGTTYTYDAFGRRAQRVNSLGIYSFTFDLAGRVAYADMPTPLWTRGEVYAGPDHIATYSSGQVYFDLHDWLGNERVKSTQTESEEQSFDNLPFGDGQGFWGNAVGQPSPTLFTGDDHDTESNLEHTWHRQYSSAQGRWMTPDPSGKSAFNLANPQSLNRYAYVNNNPINAVDPLGLYCMASQHCSDTGMFGFSGPSSYSVGGDLAFDAAAGVLATADGATGFMFGVLLLDGLLQQQGYVPAETADLGVDLTDYSTSWTVQTDLPNSVIEYQTGSVHPDPSGAGGYMLSYSDSWDTAIDPDNDIFHSYNWDTPYDLATAVGAIALLPADSFAVEAGAVDTFAIIGRQADTAAWVDAPFVDVLDVPSDIYSYPMNQAWIESHSVLYAVSPTTLGNINGTIYGLEFQWANAVGNTIIPYY